MFLKMSCFFRTQSILQIRSMTTKTKTKIKITIAPSTINTKTKCNKGKIKSSLLDLPCNLALKNRLSKEGFGPLDRAGSIILEKKGLKINPVILHLDVQSMNEFQERARKKFQEVKELKEQGFIRIGRYSKPKQGIILAGYQKLADEADVNLEKLSAELFPQKTSPHHKIQRNLVGFYLLQDLADGHLRLPVDVVAQLANLLGGGRFTKEEDAAILAWVDEHGPTDWGQLAHSLGRKNDAGSHVMSHYQVLKDRGEGKSEGAYNVEEVDAIIRDVFHQDENALEDSGGIDWALVAEKINRNQKYVYGFFFDQIRPTILRYLAGTLDQDVREPMIQEAKRRGWQYSIEMDYQLLAGLKGFEGHTVSSLSRLYQSLLGNVLARFPELNSNTEVTVEQVLEYWNTSKRMKKKKNVIKREQEIVEAFNTVMADIKSRNKTIK